MTRTWNNDPAHASMTEDQRSQMRMLEADLSASYGARHESYSLTFADFVAGVAPLFTLQPGETVTLAWAVVTAVFDGTPSPTNGVFVATASPTYAQSPSSAVLATVNNVSDTTGGGALQLPSHTTTGDAFTPVAAAVPMGILIVEESLGVFTTSVGSTTGAMTVHVIITKTA